MEMTLDSALSDMFNEDRAVNNLSTNNCDRKVRSLESQIETKMRLIDTLKSRKRSLVNKLESMEKQNMVDSSNLEFKNLPVVCHSLKDHSAVVMQHQSSELQSNQPETSRPFSLSNEKPSSYCKRLARNTDDANFKSFERRLKKRRRLDLMEKELSRQHEMQSDVDQEDGKLDSFFFVPGFIWSRLYEYQKQCVCWLWDLHKKSCGGILGDEMGLGKTIEIIAFLAGLHHSHQMNLKQASCGSSGPVCGANLIVCPATVLQQWMSEFHSWWPAMRVGILHSTGSGYRKPDKLIQTISAHTGSVLLTTYSTLVAYQDLLLSRNWSYLILDEGHKIKNPNAEVTLAVKRFSSTCHRFILSGSPMQNNLKELWSLFDFVCPGRLGPLPEFLQHFSVPITQGGYATASPVQVETAYQCACTLRDLLKPFLLRRLKADVQLDLPSKSEQVLFCQLTQYQQQLYKEYLESRTCTDILNGKGMMLTLIERMIQTMDLSYLRMDGSTPVGKRSGLIDQFNSPKGRKVFVFLLTTRVGGLGVNLTAANRVLIYDPDWNPTTDLQARERAWRIGQRRDVVIYRLLTSGTIEEKVYHRQIFKQFLTNRILKNPRQQRFFKTNDLQELFTFDNGQSNTDPQTALYLNTQGMAHTWSNLSASSNRFDQHIMKDKSKVDNDDDDDDDTNFHDEDDCGDVDAVDGCSSEGQSRTERLRRIARDLSRRIGEGRLDDVKVESKLEPKKGIRIDGKRIQLVMKKCAYDAGDGSDVSRWKLKGACNTDWFVDGLVPQRKKMDDKPLAQVDLDVREEARRVATEALQGIRLYGKVGTRNADEELASKQSVDVPLSRKLSKKSSNRTTTHSSSRTQSDRPNEPKTSTSSPSSIELPSHVTHTLQHDELFDRLTSIDRRDIVFDQIEVHRAVRKALDELIGEVDEAKPKTSGEVDDELLSVRMQRLGQVKNALLWNPNELTTSRYLHLVNLFQSQAVGSLLGTDISSSNPVPFSSSVLFDLIKMRQTERQNHSLILPQSSHVPNVDLAIQHLTAKIMRFLYENEHVTTDRIVERFGFLTGNRSNAYSGQFDHDAELWKDLSQLHFRIAFHCVAMRSRVQSKRSWVLKSEYHKLGRYLTTCGLSKAEQRLD